MYRIRSTIGLHEIVFVFSAKNLMYPIKNVPRSALFVLQKVSKPHIFLHCNERELLIALNDLPCKCLN